MADSSVMGRDGLFKRDRVLFDRQPAGVPVQAPRPRRPCAEGAADGADCGSQAEVKVARAPDGTIQQITVRCACGREITLHCDYSGRGDDNAK